MNAWVPLSRDEQDAVWDRFFKEFQFPMGVESGREPTPSLTYSIAQAFDGDMDSRVALENDLNIKTLAALRRCGGPEQRLYALDWQHQCYWFYPYRPFEVGDWLAWQVPVLPDGEFYIFLPEDFNFCIYGDCIALTICIFGQKLLNAFAHNQPLLFTKAIRRDGEPI